MRYLIAWIVFAFATIHSPNEARAQEDEFNLHQAVLAEAFDPENFFQDEYGTGPILTIEYLGDDWDYPVFSIALYRGCHSDDQKGDRSCRDRYQVRMVRAPYDGEPERPRWRGMDLLENLRKAKVSNRDELVTALSAGAVEWVEAELAECPSAMVKLKQPGELPFFFEEIVPEPTDEIIITIHADTVHVRFQTDYRGAVEFDGVPRKGNAGGWANDFAASLKGCWKPSEATPPWQRRARDDE